MIHPIHLDPISPSICSLKEFEIIYLGHFIDKNGLKPDPQTKSKFFHKESIVIKSRLNYYSYMFNPYKPSTLFVGHRQTVHTQHRCCRTQHLIRVSTEKYHQTTPLNGNGVVKLMRKRIKTLFLVPLQHN